MPNPYGEIFRRPGTKAFSAAGFELFDARTSPTGEPTAYLCREFVCRLPTTDIAALGARA